MVSAEKQELLSHDIDVSVCGLHGSAHVPLLDGVCNSAGEL
jgi:hypothetical protein